MSRPLVALTVRQPWASAIAGGAKTVECRSRRTSYRGRLAVHAGLAADRPAFEHDYVRRAVSRQAGSAPRAGTSGGEQLPRGHVVAVVEVVGCHRAATRRGGGVCCAPWGRPETWHWELAGARALRTPVRATGARGLWRPREAVAELVLAQLGGRAEDGAR